MEARLDRVDGRSLIGPERRLEWPIASFLENKAWYWVATYYRPVTVMNEDTLSYWQNAVLAFEEDYRLRRIQVWKLDSAKAEESRSFLRCEIRFGGRCEGVLTVVKQADTLVKGGYMAPDIDHPVFINEAPIIGDTPSDLLTFAKQVIDYEYEYPSDWIVERQSHDLGSLISRLKG